MHMSKFQYAEILNVTVGSGAYMCVKAYGTVASTYTLKAVYTRCPADFTEDGEQMICSSAVTAPDSEKRYTSCSSEGLCNCKAPYAKPLPEVYEGMLLTYLLCGVACINVLNQFTVCCTGFAIVFLVQEPAFACLTSLMKPHPLQQRAVAPQ